MPQKSFGFFLGLTALDLQFQLDLHPAPNTKNKALAQKLDIGGPAINAAATFAFLGGQTSVFTVCGSHSFTDYIDQQFSKYVATWTDLAPDTNQLPFLAAVISNRANGDRTIVSSPRIKHELDLAPLRRAFQKDADIILLDGFHLEGAIELASYGRKHQIPVVLDGGSWKEGLEQLLPFIDIAICSADFRMPSGDNLVPHYKAFGIKKLAITQGQHPLEYYEEDEQQAMLPVYKVHAVDSLGAGDVFHGAFCYYFSQNGEFSKSLDLAARVAAVSCQYLGAKSWMEHTDQHMLDSIQLNKTGL